MNSSEKPLLEIKVELIEALNLHKSGRLDNAEAKYSRILELMPDHANALHLLGLVNFEKGNSTRAKEMILRAIKISPNEPLFYIGLGDILQREGRFQESIESYLNALKFNPKSIAALCNLGNSYRELGDYDTAIKCYQKVIVIDPVLPHAFNNMGLAFQGQQAYKAAKTCFLKAISLAPDFFEAHNNLGNLYREMSDFPAAIKQYGEALSLSPQNTSVNYNIGILLQTNGEIEKALQFYQKAVKYFPPNADAYNNLGKYYQEQNQPDQAIYHFDKAIEIEPNHTDAQLNRSLSLLSKGNFREGWQTYEWRFKRDNWRRIYPHRLKAPRWDGSNFRGKKLLIHCEQGFGDTIWFARYLPLVKSLGGTVIFEVKRELIGLFSSLSGFDELIPFSFQHPPKISFDFYTPLMSLAWILKTTLESIPSSGPYIFASTQKKTQWRKQIDGPEFKIGLVWAAKATNEHGRSCLLKNFAPLFKIKNTRIYGLQKGEDALQADDFSGSIVNLGNKFESFADTAGAIECLDLVISVDTAVAHLAGAIGKPVWLVVPFAADWKWFLMREDSPWYPTMRIFRQSSQGDWTDAVTKVKVELFKIIGKKSSGKKMRLTPKHTLES